MIIIVLLVIAAVVIFIKRDKIKDYFAEQKHKKELAKMRKEQERLEREKKEKRNAFWDSVRAKFLPDFVTGDFTLEKFEKDPKFDKIRNTIMAILIIAKTLEQIGVAEKSFRTLYFVANKGREVITKTVEFAAKEKQC